jgi:hypothetical protein
MSSQGMSYGEGRERIMRIAKEQKHGDIRLKQNLCGSILNQVKLREGDRAAREIVREASSR